MGRVDAREERGEAVELAQLHDDLAHRRGAALGHAVVDQHGRIAGRVRHGFAEVNGRGILQILLFFGVILVTQCLSNTVTTFGLSH